jgi:hypothetical protein
VPRLAAKVGRRADPAQRLEGGRREEAAGIGANPEKHQRTIGQAVNPAQQSRAALRPVTEVEVAAAKKLSSCRDRHRVDAPAAELDRPAGHPEAGEIAGR